MQAHKKEINGVTLLNVLEKVHKLRGAGDLYNVQSKDSNWVCLHKLRGAMCQI